MTDAHKTTIVHAPPAGAIEAGQRMHPMVAAAMAAKPDAATLREFLSMQREWEAEEARRSYTAAMIGLKRDMPTVVAKDALVDWESNSGKRTTYRHESLAGIMEAVTEPLTNHGFSLSWTTEQTDKEIQVTCHLTHRDGHSEHTSLRGAPDTGGQKSALQAVMSSVTLLKRYTASTLLGIASRDMTEPAGESATSPDASGRIDAKRSLAMVNALRKAGKTVEAGVALVGRPVAEWTDVEIRALWAWIRPAEEPTHDPSTGELSPEEEARMGG